MQITPGARAGLGEPTATCRWLFEGTLVDLPGLTSRLRAAVSQLWPSEPMHGVDIDDWPQAFLVDGSPIDGLGAWGAALTVAIQRLGTRSSRRGTRTSGGSGCHFDSLALATRAGV